MEVPRIDSMISHGIVAKKKEKEKGNTMYRKFCHESRSWKLIPRLIKTFESLYGRKEWFDISRRGDEAFAKNFTIRYINTSIYYIYTPIRPSIRVPGIKFSKNGSLRSGASGNTEDLFTKIRWRIDEFQLR